MVGLRFASTHPTLLLTDVTYITKRLGSEALASQWEMVGLRFASTHPTLLNNNNSLYLSLASVKH